MPDDLAVAVALVLAAVERVKAIPKAAPIRTSAISIGPASSRLAA
jgi:hypothetical protein